MIQTNLNTFRRRINNNNNNIFNGSNGIPPPFDCIQYYPGEHCNRNTHRWCWCTKSIFYFIRWVLNFKLEYVYIIICIRVAMSSCSIVFERRSYKFLESVKYNSENFIYIGSATTTRFTRPVRGNSQQLYNTALLDCNGIKGIDNYSVWKNEGGVLRYLGHLYIRYLYWTISYIGSTLTFCAILIDNNDIYQTFSLQSLKYY